jgi:hypothetical protein
MANSRITLRTAATLATSDNGVAQDSPYHRGVVLTVTTTAKASSASLVVKLQGQNNVGTWYDLPGAATAAITTETTTVLVMRAGVAATANVSVPAPLPRAWRAVYTISGGTFTVGVYADLVT